jgi:hypothetical protein
MGTSRLSTICEREFRGTKCAQLMLTDARAFAAVRHRPHPACLLVYFACAEERCMIDRLSNPSLTMARKRAASKAGYTALVSSAMWCNLRRLKISLSAGCASGAALDRLSP